VAGRYLAGPTKPNGRAGRVGGLVPSRRPRTTKPAVQQRGDDDHGAVGRRRQLATVGAFPKHATSLRLAGWTA
jgi:hypothetical protein